MAEVSWIGVVGLASRPSPLGFLLAAYWNALAGGGRSMIEMGGWTGGSSSTPSCSPGGASTMTLVEQEEFHGDKCHGVRGDRCVGEGVWSEQADAREAYHAHGDSHD